MRAGLNFFLETAMLPPPPIETNAPSIAPELTAVAVELLKVLARKRYPWLSPAAALIRLAGELAQADAAEDELRALREAGLAPPSGGA